MEKITSFMRVTKKRKALDERRDVVKPPLAVEKSVPAAANAATLKKPKPTVPTAGAQETDADGELYENGIHVPTFIYAAVKYTRKTERHAVDEKTQRVVEYITDRFEVPLDFETSNRFGPHSGMSYESRLLRAYKLKMLTPKKESTTVIPPICIACAKVGHVDRDCPDAF